MQDEGTTLRQKRERERESGSRVGVGYLCLCLCPCPVPVPDLGRMVPSGHDGNTLASADDVLHPSGTALAGGEKPGGYFHTAGSVEV